MKTLQTELCGVVLKNPVITASGTFNYGQEFKQFYDISLLGGISLKGLTLEKREGNDSPRIAETYGGIINSVGLQNPGLDSFLEDYLPALSKENTILIANIAGNSTEEYCQMAERISQTSIAMIELNISCPNVKKGGVDFGIIPTEVEKIVSIVKKHCSKPLIVKLTPNVANIADNARAAEVGGADSISLINTIKAMAIDYKTQKPIIANVIGGLSGRAIKPIALRMVYECYKAVSIPIIGMGGIFSYTDAIEFMLAGASAVQIGTANMINPKVAIEIIDNLQCYCKDNNLKNIREIVGGLKV